MVKKATIKKTVFSVFLLIAAAFVVYFVFFGESEEMKIRRMLNEFCMDAAKSQEKSSPAALLLKTNVLKSYFTDPCNLSVYHGVLQGSYTDVRAANEIMRANLFLQSSTLSFSDILITINMPEAEVSFTGRFQAKLKSGSSVDEVREVELKLRKVEKKWKISSAAVQKIMDH